MSSRSTTWSPASISAGATVNCFPTFSGGAHVVVEMRDGERTRLNPYSLMGSPLDTREYTISVRRDDVGRGGSLFMHRQVKPGLEMVISYPVNLFSLDLRAKKHLMLAGGIGITPFMAQTRNSPAPAGNFRIALHLPHRVARHLCRCAGRALRQPGQALPRRPRRAHRSRPAVVVATARHASLCLRPGRMINWVRDRAAALGWPPETVHYEHFAAPQPGLPST